MSKACCLVPRRRVIFHLCPEEHVRLWEALQAGRFFLGYWKLNGKVMLCCSKEEDLHPRISEKLPFFWDSRLWVEKHRIYIPQSEAASICVNLLSQHYRVIIWLHDWHLAGFTHLVWSWPLSTCTREGSSTEIWSQKICFSRKKANSRCPAVNPSKFTWVHSPHSLHSPPNILQVTDMGNLAQNYSNWPNWDCGPDL